MKHWYFVKFYIRWCGSRDGYTSIINCDPGEILNTLRNDYCDGYGGRDIEIIEITKLD